MENDQQKPQKPVLRDRSGKLLPGSKSLNPGGRPLGFAEYVKKRTGANGEALYEILWKIATGQLVMMETRTIPRKFGGVDVVEVPVRPTISQIKDATIALLEHAHGKAPSRVEVTGAGGGPIQHTHAPDLSKLSLEELRQWQALLEKTAGPIVEGELIETADTE